MRRLAATLALAAAAAPVGFMTTGGRAAPPPTLAQAAARTAQTASQRFAVDVRITKAARHLVLHVRGAASAQAATVRLKLDDLVLRDGTVLPGMTGAMLLDGPFLYEQTPSTFAATGKLRWIRLHVADLGPGSSELRNLHDLLPAALLRVLGAAQATQSRGVYTGTLAYDDPVVRSGLEAMTGGVDYRRLRVTAWAGRDGLVSRARIAGRTADGTSTFTLDARLFGFGSAVRVSPPPQGAFLDPAREKIVS